MRILCYAQHLSGVGHFVRMHALASGLSAAHDVHLVAGGRPVPHARDPAALRVVRLPPLARTGGTLVALDTTASTRSVLEDRVRALTRAIERIRPEVVLVDHYPFSKWELEAEVAAAIDAARVCNPAVRIFCSLRDVVRQTRYEQTAPDAYAERVLAGLRSRFDGILVHADPAFTRLEEHFARCADLPVPVAYTGFVIQPPPSTPTASVQEPYAVLSCGGGAGGLAFLLASMEAFRRLAADGALGSMQLVVFPGAFTSDSDFEALAAAAERGPFDIRRFGPEFASALDGGALSISRAGYNTCVALLRARARAVLAPDPVMSDQGFRARRFAALALAQVVEGDPPDVASVMVAMRRALAGPAPQHRFDIDGVVRTGALL